MPPEVAHRVQADSLEHLRKEFVLDRGWRFVFAKSPRRGKRRPKAEGSHRPEHLNTVHGADRDRLDEAYRRVTDERVSMSIEVKGALSDR